MTPDVNVVVIDFKTSKQNEIVTENEDGSYTLLINARLSYDGQLKAYEHGMRHIKENDFEKNNVQEIEYFAHNHDITPEPAQKYLERIQQIKKEKRRIERQIKKDQERVKFIRENCDVFKRAEHHYLYGNNL